MGGMIHNPDPRSFLYRPDGLDPECAKALVSESLGACDDGELYLQYSAVESFGFDDGRLKTADYSTDSGFGLRGVSGEMTGFSHSNEISEAAIKRATQTLQLLDPAKGDPAPPPRGNLIVPSVYAGGKVGLTARDIKKMNRRRGQHR